MPEHDMNVEQEAHDLEMEGKTDIQLSAMVAALVPEKAETPPSPGVRGLYSRIAEEKGISVEEAEEMAKAFGF